MGCIAFDATTANTKVMPLVTSIRGISIPRKELLGDGGSSAIAGGMATTLLDFLREHAAHLLLPTSEVLELPSQESVDNCGDEQRVTRLPPQKGISDALWRSRHLPRHLYRSNPRIISDENQVLDE